MVFLWYYYFPCIFQEFQYLTDFKLSIEHYMKRVGNICFNLLSPFLSIVWILSSQAILFQILLHVHFPRLPWSTLLPFPIYFKFHQPTYLRVDVSMDDLTIPPQTALNYHIFDLYSKSHPIPKNISRRPINQSYPTHPTNTPCNSLNFFHTTNSCTRCPWFWCFTLTTNPITQIKKLFHFF